MAERLRRAEPSCVRPLFDGWEETFLWSAMEGGMGCLWMAGDKLDAAVCQSGDFLFFSGDPASDSARLLLETLACDGRFHILISRTRAQHEAVRPLLKGRVTEGERYAFHKEGTGFDPAHLAKLARTHPADVTLCLFDEAICRQALSQEWSRDFLSQFPSVEAFLRQGLGVAALRNGELVGGASSCIVWTGGMEIEVDTRADQRRRGIATACAARLVLECLERGLLPSWDAASAVSARLAETLGFRPSGAYPVWLLNE